MAVKEVSTWDGIITALFNFDTGDIIRLTADINLNNEYPLGVNSTDLIAGGYEGSSVTIDGNGYAIRNLRTKVGSPANIFYKTGGNPLTITFVNIDFVNIILAGASLVQMTSSGDTLKFQNCRFVGSRSGTAYLININANVNLNLTSCFINVPWQGAGQTSLGYTSLIPKNDSAATSAVANYCWFREKYTGWTYAASYRYDTTTRFYSFSYFKLNGCYIDGSMSIPNLLTYNDSYAYYSPFFSRYIANYTASAQNVFDVNLTCLNTVTDGSSVSSQVHYSSFSGVVKKNAYAPNGVECSFSGYSKSDFDGGTYVNPILATPEQMRDAEWLSNEGFDIIIPE